MDGGVKVVAELLQAHLQHPAHTPTTDTCPDTSTSNLIRGARTILPIPPSSSSTAWQPTSLPPFSATSDGYIERWTYLAPGRLWMTLVEEIIEGRAPKYVWNSASASTPSRSFRHRSTSCLQWQRTIDEKGWHGVYSGAGGATRTMTSRCTWTNRRSSSAAPSRSCSPGACRTTTAPATASRRSRGLDTSHYWVDMMISALDDFLQQSNQRLAHKLSGFLTWYCGGPLWW